MRNKMNGKTEQAMGSVKETVGKAIKSDEMEWKGKMQKVSGRMMEAGEEAFDNAKEKVVEKANELLENFEEKRSER